MLIQNQSAEKCLQTNFTMRNKKIKKFIMTLAVLLFWIGVWQVAYMLIEKEILVVSPLQVLTRLFELSKTKSFWKSIGCTFLRICSGYLFGVCFGTTLAVLTSSISFFKKLFYPIISLVKATPVVSFIILALVWIKKNGVPVFITFLIVLPIIWANVSEAIDNTDKGMLEMAKMFHFGRLKTIKTIYIHSVLPYFAAGCTTAMGLAWKAGVAAEVIAIPQSSIGYHLYRSKINIETADLFAWTLVVIILSVILERIILCLLKRIKGGKKSAKD